MLRWTCTQPARGSVVREPRSPLTLNVYGPVSLCACCQHRRNWDDIQCNWGSLSSIIDHWGDWGSGVCGVQAWWTVLVWVGGGGCLLRLCLACPLGLPPTPLFGTLFLTAGPSLLSNAPARFVQTVTTFLSSPRRTLSSHRPVLPSLAYAPPFVVCSPGPLRWARALARP